MGCGALRECERRRALPLKAISPPAFVLAEPGKNDHQSWDGLKPEGDVGDFLFLARSDTETRVAFEWDRPTGRKLGGLSCRPIPIAPSFEGHVYGFAGNPAGVY